MNIAILGAAGFIGTNLAIRLAEDPTNNITALDERKSFFSKDLYLGNINIVEGSFGDTGIYDRILEGIDIVFHLISTNNPTTSNVDITNDITENISITLSVMESCVKHHVKKIVFVSSGGTVYGEADHYPIKEESATNPITTYGIQKLAIEKIMYLYRYVHGLDYSITRLSNPYGKYQRPDGRLGVLTTFIYNALHQIDINVYGDGTIVRDYIYIDDAISGVLKVAFTPCDEKIFNIGSGIGLSINEILQKIEEVLQVKLKVNYLEKRPVDVSVNYLDVSKYERFFGKLTQVSVEEGIIKTADYVKELP